jgi:hypothetical protein
MKPKDYSLLRTMSNLKESKSNPNDNPCLLVMFGEKVTLARNVTWPLKGFVVGERHYYDATFGEWTGFYDWLRDGCENVLGVRYTPFEQTEFLTQELKELSYAKADPPRHIEIYFSERREFDEKLSCDQEFLYDAIFRSDDGKYAIGFGMEKLTESNLRGLERIGAKWAAARPLE